MNAHSLSMMPVEKIPEGEKYDGGYLEFADMGYVREMAALAKEADVHYVCYCIRDEPVRRGPPRERPLGDERRGRATAILTRSSRYATFSVSTLSAADTADLRPSTADITKQ